MLFSELLKSENDKLIKKILTELFKSEFCYIIYNDYKTLKVYFLSGGYIDFLAVGWIFHKTEHYFNIPKYLEVLKNNDIEFDEKEN